MQARPQNRYALKDLHQEIDLLDRKIAHCQNHEKFGSDQERETALHKLTKARGPLVKAALQMVKDGIEFDPKNLPRSLKPTDEATEARS